MAKYKITKFRTVVKPTADGRTWNKVEIKTDVTGDDVIELGNGVSKYQKENLKEGDIIEGYIERKPWTKRDGTVGGYNVKLNGITVDYLYALMKKLHPDLETIDLTKTSLQAETEPEEEQTPASW
jgi:hypothetical protein